MWVVIGGAAGVLFGAAIVFFRRRQRPDPLHDPSVGVRAPVKPKPKDLSGAVALAEPDDERR
jgi:hypothetical protein